MSDTSKEYANQFSDDGFWSKLAGYAKAAGSEAIEKALWLFYAYKDKETPVWAKTAIIGALGYFISPIDAIPDIAPVVGYADDIGVLALAVATVGAYIDDNVKEKTAAKLKEWFGS